MSATEQRLKAAVRVRLGKGGKARTIQSSSAHRAAQLSQGTTASFLTESSHPDPAL
jgi:hypothetical protein